MELAVAAVVAAAGEGTGGEIAGAFQRQTLAARGHRLSTQKASSLAVAAVAAAGIAGGQSGELGLWVGREDVGWQQLGGPPESRRPMFQVLAANHM